MKTNRPILLKIALILCLVSQSLPGLVQWAIGSPEPAAIQKLPCAVDAIAERNSPDARVFLSVVRSLNAFLEKTPSVSALRDLYWSGSAEIVKIFRDHPDVFDEAKATLIELQPAIAAYLSGRADQFVISSSLANRLQKIYDLLWEHGSDSLRQGVTAARDWFARFEGLAGKTLAVVGPSYGFVPLNRPFLHISGLRFQDSVLTMEVNYVGNLDYTLWSASRLTPNEWSPVPNGRVTIDGLTVELADPNPRTAASFYQVRATDSSSVIGLPRSGEAAFEFVVKSDQAGLVHHHYGYLTHIFGVPNDAMFSNAAKRDETTARFTIVADTRIDQRHELGDVILTTAPGSLTIYYDAQSGANFDQPGTFVRGVVIGTYSLHYQNVLSVYAPNRGINQATADYQQSDGLPFELAGKTTRLGQPGLQGRLSVTGTGTRTVVEPLSAFFYSAGHATVTSD